MVVEGDFLAPAPRAVVLEPQIPRHWTDFLAGFKPFKPQRGELFSALPPNGNRCHVLPTGGLGRPDGLEFFTALGHELHGALDEGFRRLNTHRKRLQHVRFRREANAPEQRCISRAVTRRFQKSNNALFRCLSTRIHIGTGWHPPLFHGRIQGGFHGFPDERPQHRPGLVRLGCNQGHLIRVIRPIGGVRIDKNVGRKRMK